MPSEKYMNEEQRIRAAFQQKDWNRTTTADSWQIFKVMAEFVEGFEKLARIGPCVSIFGSARTEPGTKYYYSTHAWTLISAAIEKASETPFLEYMYKFKSGIYLCIYILALNSTEDIFMEKKRHKAFYSF